MTRRKKAVIGALVLTLSLAVAAVAAGIATLTACGPNGSWGQSFRPGFHRFHPGPHGKDIVDFIMWKMDHHAKDLGLDEAQRKEYERVKVNIRTAFAEAMQRRREFHAMVQDEMSRENPNLSALAGLVKERVNDIPDMVSKHIDRFMDFYNSLHESQKAKVIEMFRSRIEH